jgi:hypothetical protein
MQKVYAGMRRISAKTKQPRGFAARLINWRN